jgi:hypothetical protein
MPNPSFTEEMKRKLLRQACAFALLLSVYPIGNRAKYETPTHSTSNPVKNVGV